MAKGQKRSSREARKPKQAEPKPAASPRSFPGPLDRPVADPSAWQKGVRR